MAKDKLPKPMYFPLLATQGQAKQRFKELVDKKCYGELFLVYSDYWLCRGYWITFEEPILTTFDILIQKHHNKNPQKWIPPPTREPDEEDEE